MADRPIIFSAPMVRALLDGRKTQAQRLAWGKSRPMPKKTPQISLKMNLGGTTYSPATVWQKIGPGDRLWVRETADITGSVPHYKADNPPAFIRWTPSIHMPRWASRLTLIVTDVRWQKLQDMTRADAIAEGVKWLEDDRGWTADGKLVWGRPKEAFAGLWDSLYGKGAWDANPEVVALTFEAQHRNIDRRP